MKSFESKAQGTVEVQLGASAKDVQAGLLSLSKSAYDFFVVRYHEALVDNNMVNKQLAYAQQLLAKATTRLNSSQSGLAAATAAAFAA
jgi:hypothetical protein